MLETSKDLVNVSLSFGIVLLAVLLAFALYYFIKIMKDLSEMIHEARDTIQELKNHLHAWEEFLDSLKERMTSAGAYLPLVVDGITKIMNFISRQKEKKRSKKEG
ncbi:MAG: hypothetical protein AAB793_00485 [Patescibacteria group bacterium]